MSIWEPNCCFCGLRRYVQTRRSSNSCILKLSSRRTHQYLDKQSCSTTPHFPPDLWPFLVCPGCRKCKSRRNSTAKCHRRFVVLVLVTTHNRLVDCHEIYRLGEVLQGQRSPLSLQEVNHEMPPALSVNFGAPSRPSFCNYFPREGLIIIVHSVVQLVINALH